MADQPLEELLASALATLSGPRHKLADAAADAPGLYALHGRPESWLDLGLGQSPTNTALFVAKFEDLRDLQLLTAGRSAQSTVRRTFAALLRDHLELRGLPRNQKKPEQLNDYALSDEHDALLTTWMTDHLEIAIWPQPPECTNLGDIEVAVLKKWSPPLNLRDTRSTMGAKVTTARKQMAADARAWARERGHKL
jgi:hypothetical protein